MTGQKKWFVRLNGLRKRTTKREEFLKAMDEFIPWVEWVSLIEPYYIRAVSGDEHLSRINYRINRRIGSVQKTPENFINWEK